MEAVKHARFTSPALKTEKCGRILICVTLAKLPNLREHSFSQFVKWGLQYPCHKAV